MGKDVGQGQGEKSAWLTAWLLPTSLRCLRLLASAPTPPPPHPVLNSHCTPCSQHSASKFTSLSFYPKRRERPGWQEERGKPTAEPVLGTEGKPREEGQGGSGEGVFWKRRRLFLSQERREYCLKQRPSWGCATSRSPTSSGLCVRLSHGADSGFESLLCSLASPVPLPSPCCPAVSLLRTPRPRVCETLLRSLLPTSPKPPLHLPTSPPRHPPRWKAGSAFALRTLPSQAPGCGLSSGLPPDGLGWVTESAMERTGGLGAQSLRERRVSSLGTA